MYFGSVLLFYHNTGLLQEHSKISFCRLVTRVDGKAMSVDTCVHHTHTHTHTHIVCVVEIQKASHRKVFVTLNSKI